MKEKGVIKQILEKYKGGSQICPDMSGQPLGINNTFTAFLLLLGENLMFIYIFRDIKHIYTFQIFLKILFQLLNF